MARNAPLCSLRLCWFGDQRVLDAVGGIDPDGGRFGWRHGRVFHEPLGCMTERLIECGLPGGMHRVGLAIVDLVGCHQSETDMVMIVIVPAEEATAELLRVFAASEAAGKLRLVFQGLEVAFRERVVVGNMRAAVGFGDAEIGQPRSRRRFACLNNRRSRTRGKTDMPAAIGKNTVASQA